MKRTRRMRESKSKNSKTCLFTCAFALNHVDVVKFRRSVGDQPREEVNA